LDTICSTGEVKNKLSILFGIYSWKTDVGRTGHGQMNRTGRSDLMIENLIMPTGFQ
jgi:hypothetical protein